MDAIEFLREWDRMCDSMDDCCEGCDLSKWGIGCKEYAQKHPEDAVRTVKGWIDKHPVKTRQSEFLKMFPEARKEGKALDIDPCQLDMRLRNSCGCRACHECREEYWLAEVDD